MELSECTAEEMVKGDFQYIKEKVEEISVPQKILLRVPGLPLDSTFPEGMIKSGHMEFTP